MNQQIDIHYRNESKKGENSDLMRVDESCPDSLTWWMEQYFKYEVTTAPPSQKAQKRNISLFIAFMLQEEGTDDRPLWSPRLSGTFRKYLSTVIDGKTGHRQWSDSSITRTMAHLKTFSKWINKLRPFPLGDPMEKISTAIPGNCLEVERALTDSERRRILDAADRLLISGGLSRDRNRHNGKERPKRKGYRPYRNRAIIYTLIETGMRRAAVVNITMENIDFRQHIIRVTEKGGLSHTYHISQEGIKAIQDYLVHEKGQDFDKWDYNALFLSAATNPRGNGKMTPQVVNKIWNEVCQAAGVIGKTPHSARHAMGRHIIEKTGNVAAVQRQLGHRNATYSMQYARITGEELQDVLNDRNTCLNSE